MLRSADLVVLKYIRFIISRLLTADLLILKLSNIPWWLLSIRQRILINLFNHEIHAVVFLCGCCLPVGNDGSNILRNSDSESLLHRARTLMISLRISQCIHNIHVFKKHIIYNINFIGWHKLCSII